MIDGPTLNRLENSAEKMLRQLSKTVLQGLKPHPGPYAFFNHVAQAHERLGDCDRTVKRLFDGRKRLTQLEHLKESAVPRDWPPGKAFPDEAQRIMRQESELERYMKQDLETLYLFGGIMLDQWALLAFYVAGVIRPEKRYGHPFRDLVIEFEKEKEVRTFPIARIYPIWTRLKSQMLWLYYQIRFYRNKFIVHSDRPWQRGTGRSVFGEDFNLWIPTPPGWLDDIRIDDEIEQLLYLAPKHIREAPNGHWEKTRPRALIERIFNGIGDIEKKVDRKNVARLFSKVGGSTPSFQIVAENLLQFLCSALEQLNNIAKTDLGSVNIGRSRECTEE